MEPLPDILRDSRRQMAALDADYQVARQNVRAANAMIRDAQARGESAEYVEGLARHRDGALSQALAVREVVSGITEERLETRAAFLAANGPKVVEPEATPVIPEGFNAGGWDGASRHYLTGTFYSPDGYRQDGTDRDGYDRGGWGHDGRHRNGTKWSDEGRDRDGWDRLGWDATGYNKHTGTQVNRAGETMDEHRARVADEKAAAQQAPAPEPVTSALAPQHAELYERLVYGGQDEVVDGREAARLLGADERGLAGLPKAGNGYRVADVADAAQEHTVRHARALVAAGVPPIAPRWASIAWEQQHHDSDHRLGAGEAAALLGLHRESDLAAIDAAHVPMVRDAQGTYRLGDIASLAAPFHPGGEVRAHRPGTSAAAKANAQHARVVDALRLQLEARAELTRSPRAA